MRTTPLRRFGHEQATTATTPYLLFAVHGVAYGVPLLGVREVMDLVRLAPVAEAPEALLGTQVLRGHRIPVVELGAVLEQRRLRLTRTSCSLVVQSAVVHGDSPAGETLSYDIRDPRGQSVATGGVKLNAFGALWAELPLTESMPLGVYTVNFTTKGNHRGSAQLFRLEEYKLPEFLVKVTTPEGKQYRLGDTIEATVDASYYFGGPVANATVEVVVTMEPFHRYWYPWREYSWYYDTRPSYGGRGSIVKRETLQTDAAGRAVVRIETSPDSVDQSYNIEARVVDASRREVRGTGNVRVTKQRYAVFAHPGADLGIMTGWGGTQRLTSLNGEARALEMIFTAKRVDAHEALSIGLICEIAEDPLVRALN